MKPGESLQLTESWWKAGKPANLTDTGLSAALRAFQDADSKFQSAKTGPFYLAVIKALDAVNTARVATIGKCGNNPLLKDVKAALAKDGAITQRKNVLKAAMTSVLEPLVTKQETALVTETKLVDDYEKAAATQVSKLDAALKSKDEKALKAAGKELGRISTNAENVAMSLCTDDVSAIGTKFGAVLGPHFPQLSARLGAVKKASVANNIRIRAIRALVQERSEHVKDD